MEFSRRSGLLLVVFVATAMVFMACGSGDWEAVSKVGNTWEYEGETSGARVTAKVLGTWKVGSKVYAEIAPNYAAFSNVSKLCTWDDKNKEFLHAGDASLFNDGTKQFFLAGRVLGAIKGSASAYTNADGTIIRYLGEETVTVPAGKYSTFKFSHLNEDLKVDMYVWYASKTGVVRVRAYGDTWQLTKFTEGKKADPKVLGGANAEVSALFAENFFKTAQAGEVQGLQRFFAAGDGQDDFNKQKNGALSTFVQRASDPEVRLDQASYAFLGDSAVGIRFLQFDDRGVLPTIVRTDAVLTLVPEGKDMRVQKISIAHDTLY